MDAGLKKPTKYTSNKINGLDNIKDYYKNTVNVPHCHFVAVLGIKTRGLTLFQICIRRDVPGRERKVYGHTGNKVSMMLTSGHVMLTCVSD